MAYGDFTDLPRRPASNKVLCDTAFNIAENRKYYGYQRGLASVVYKLFGKKSSSSGIKNENMSNQELAKELHKLIIRKFETQ